jgi:hypothetical protein
MRRHITFVIGLFIIPLSLLAQEVNWDVMERPYFVNTALPVPVKFEMLKPTLTPLAVMPLT